MAVSTSPSARSEPPPIIYGSFSGPHLLCGCCTSRWRTRIISARCRTTSSSAGRWAAWPARWPPGYGYADPFVGHTGPTAWVPPLYPLMLAGVFKLFGVYTALSAWVILTITAFFSAATAPLPIYGIASALLSTSARLPVSVGLDLGAVSGGDAVRGALGLGDVAHGLSVYRVLLLALRMIASASISGAARQTADPWLLFGASGARSRSQTRLCCCFCRFAASGFVMRRAPARHGTSETRFWRPAVSRHPCAVGRAQLARISTPFIPIRDNLGAELEPAAGRGRMVSCDGDHCRW